jgi:predicted anti-sigma-YlaC factor YlaD
MNCIKDEIIQKYIDGEAAPAEISLIENHIASCSKCASRIENHRRLSAAFKKAVTQLSKETIEVPEFEIPSKSTKQHSFSYTRLFYIVAAASILLIVIVLARKKEIKAGDEIKIEIGSVMDVDANRTVSQLPLIISVVDSDGNISEYYIN